MLAAVDIVLGLALVNALALRLVGAIEVISKFLNAFDSSVEGALDLVEAAQKLLLLVLSGVHRFILLLLLGLNPGSLFLVCLELETVLLVVVGGLALFESDARVEGGVDDHVDVALVGIVLVDFGLVRDVLLLSVCVGSSERSSSGTKEDENLGLSTVLRVIFLA